MMKAIRYMMVDIRRTKSQLYCMMFFGAFAYFFAGGRSIISAIIYLIFAATLMQGGVFTYEQKHETGFTSMLPGTDLEKCAGRFIMGVLLLGIGMATFTVITIFVLTSGIAETNFFLETLIGDAIKTNYLPEMLISAIGIGLMFIAIQNVLFYIIGKGNSQQFMTFIHMIPGFILLIISTIFTVIFIERGEEVTQITSVLMWIKDNSILFSLGVLVLGIVFTIAGIFISEKIVRKKDFA